MNTILSLSLIVFPSLIFAVLYIVSVQPATLALRIGDRAYKLCGTTRAVAMAFEFVTIGGYILFSLQKSDPLCIRFTWNPLIGIVSGVVILVLTMGLMLKGMIDAGKEAAAPQLHGKLYGGIYNYLRHPQSLGEMLCWFGIALVLNNVTLLVYSLVWLPVFVTFNIIEDNDLSVRFGKDYIEYTRRVGMFWKKKASN